jgi:hypothetical protein
VVTNPDVRRTPKLRFRVLLAGDAEATEEDVAGPYRAYTPGDPVWPVMIAGNITLY